MSAFLIHVERFTLDFPEISPSGFYLVIVCTIVMFVSTIHDFVQVGSIFSEVGMREMRLFNAQS